RSITQAVEGLGPQPKAGDSSRRSWLCRSASAPSQQPCEPVQDRCSGPCSRVLLTCLRVLGLTPPGYELSLLRSLKNCPARPGPRRARYAQRAEPGETKELGLTIRKALSLRRERFPRPGVDGRLALGLQD